MDDLRISILIPSAYRPQKLERALNAIYASELVVPAEVLLALMCDDTESLQLAKQYPIDAVIERDKSEYPAGAAQGWRRLSKLARNEWLCLMGDDAVVQWDWLIEARIACKKLMKPGLIGFNDLHNDGVNYAAHYMVHRQFIDEHCNGEFIPKEYLSWWFDWEICDIAKQYAAYLYAEQVIVEHRHYEWNPSEFDKTYADALALHEVDYALYKQRQIAGFPYG